MKIWFDSLSYLKSILDQHMSQSARMLCDDRFYSNPEEPPDPDGDEDKDEDY